MEFKPPQPFSFSDDAAVIWPLFKQKFFIYLTATKKLSESDDVKIAMLLSCMGEEAIEIFNTFDLSEEDKKSYDLVVQAFDKFVAPRRSVVLHRFNFFSRIREEGELFSHFLTELKRLAKLCQFQEEESLIRDRIVIGINDRPLQERLLRSGDIDLKEAIKICQAAELGKIQQQNLTKEFKEVCVSDTTFECTRCGTKHGPRKCPAFG